MNPLNIAIFGIGVMGTLFASHLTGRVNITLFGAWPEQIKTLQKEGLFVTQLDGSQSHYNVQATNKLADVPVADIALVLVKSHQTMRVARQVLQVLQPDGIAITLQNGLGNLEILSDIIGKHRVALGITSQGATLLSPGNLRHAGNGPTFLAKTPGLEKKLNEVASLFNEVGIVTTLVQNTDSLVWAKLTINSGINPLTALLEVLNGELLENRIFRQVMYRAANEVIHLAEAQNIILPFTDAEKQIEEVCRATAKNYSSMLQDLCRGAPTEVDFISGAIVKIGQKMDIPTPVNEFLLQQVKAKEAGQKFDKKLLQTII